MVRASRFFGVSMVVLGCVLLVGCTPIPQLSVDATTLNVGPNDTKASFNVFNSGKPNSKLEFKVAKAAVDTWYAVDVTSGTSTGSSDKKKVTITINTGAAKALATDKIGNINVTATIDGAEQKKTVKVDKGHNFFTQEFSAGGASALVGKSLIFTSVPNSASKYALTVVDAPEKAALPVSPYGTPIDFTTDPAQIAMANGEFTFYDEVYTAVNVSSQGYLGFTADVTSASPLEAHFSIPRISVLTGIDATAGGTVSSKDLPDRLAITYDDVPNTGTTGGGNTAQAELFYDANADNGGTIRLTYLTVITEDSIVGLSDGGGVGSFTSGNLTQSYNTAAL